MQRRSGEVRILTVALGGQSSLNMEGEGGELTVYV
jgi:hypothetical protein